ncbi:MAG: pilus assembly protein PilM [Candidatus Omnitrophica bacterium]|nr:pilus assembly protein PilM [Candidatus Omnitrophota bacterium]
MNLALYFGKKSIEGVFLKGKRIINSFSIPEEKYAAGELEEKVPLEVKVVALLKEELRRNRIETKKLKLSLSGKDLIIRSFELPPNIPAEELKGAVNFEVRKYLPFKTEELISDFEVKLDKKEKKNLTLFLGIKRETLSYYFSIIKELNLKLDTIEYAGFSILRIIKLINLKTKGVFAFLYLDMEDEANFVVMEKDFILFSRDIYLSSIAGSDIESILEKLKSEIQLSLDYYYHRKFPSKHIDKIFILGLSQYKELVEKLKQELDIHLDFVDLSNYISRNIEPSAKLATFKAMAVGLEEQIKIPLRSNLLLSYQTLVSPPPVKRFRLEIKPHPQAVLISILIMVLPPIYVLYQRNNLQKELSSILSKQPKLITISFQKSYEELVNIENDYRSKVGSLKNLLAKYPSFTLQLNILPSILPKGVWLTSLEFQQKETEKRLLLKGNAYLKDYQQEVNAINDFFSNIKNNPNFSKVYKNIEIVSIERNTIGEKEVTSFGIICK